MKRNVLAVVLIIVASSSTSALTAEKNPQGKVLDDVLNCARVLAEKERLACFDRTVMTLASAQARQEIIVTDKEEIREARRGLFGFSLPKLRLFGDGGRDTAAGSIDAIESEIASVAESSSGGLLIGLSSGARWMQIDADYVNRPKVGQMVTIRRATMGGYTAKVGKGRAFRVRRLSD